MLKWVAGAMILQQLLGGRVGRQGRDGMGGPGTGRGRHRRRPGANPGMSPLRVAMLVGVGAVVLLALGNAL